MVTMFSKLAEDAGKNTYPMFIDVFSDGVYVCVKRKGSQKPVADMEVGEEQAYKDGDACAPPPILPPTALSCS